MNWDYNNLTGNNWIKKPLTEQLELLRTYYPIGDTFLYNKKPVSVIDYKIIDSKIYSACFYKVIISLKNDIEEDLNIHPGCLIPFRRNINLKKLGI